MKKNKLLITALLAISLIIPLHSAEKVETGLDRLAANKCQVLKGKRVALITNMSAITREGESIVSVLQTNSINIVKIFTPEHGFSVDRDEKVSNSKLKDIPLISLYGKSRKIKTESLSDVDVLIYDIQGVGARYYTYIATMVYGMRAAADRGIPYVVLDRPNPSGTSIRSGFISGEGLYGHFTAIYPIPVRHGMTHGELALMFNKEYAIGARLKVIKMEGYRRDMLISDTGLPWVNPSPNIKTEAGALLYSSLGWLETTNISMGRGTDTPFEMLGAPYIDSAKLAASLKDFTDVSISPITFVPKAKYHKFFGQECRGIKITLKDPHSFDGFKLGLAVFAHLKANYPEHYISFAGLKVSAGVRNLDTLIKKEGVNALNEETRKALTAYNKRAEKYQLYK
jgi:uncharacterized protein YbbC (DUF1343 family)